MPSGESGWKPRARSAPPKGTGSAAGNGNSGGKSAIRKVLVVAFDIDHQARTALLTAMTHGKNLSPNYQNGGVR